MVLSSLITHVDLVFGQQLEHERQAGACRTAGRTELTSWQQALGRETLKP